MSPLALALLILADAAALALAIRARAPWQVRAVVVVGVLGIAFPIWAAASADAGWPVSASIPDGSAVLGCIVQEPSPGDAGRVYLWLVPPVAGGSNPLAQKHADGAPRAYVEPYSLGLEAACQQAQKMSGGGGQPAIHTHAHGHVGGQNGPQTRFRIYQLPPPHPSPKG